MAKWPINEMAKNDETANLRNCKLAKPQVDKMASWWEQQTVIWPKGKMVKQQDEETTSWWRCDLVKLLIDKSVNRWNGKFKKLQVGKTTSQ